MGYQDRDYYRDGADTYATAGLANIPVVLFWLLIVNVVVFLGQVLFVRQVMPQGGEAIGELLRGLQQGFYVSPVQEWLALDVDAVLRGQVWRLVTHAFCHDRNSILHIVFNMAGLFYFGWALETRLGAREFLAFYLSAVLVAGFAYMGIELVLGERHLAVGASGAVMAVLMAHAIWYPDTEIYLFFIVPVPIRVAVVLFALFDLYPMLRRFVEGPGIVETGIAHAAHLGGLAFGFGYSWYEWSLTGWFFDRPAPTRGRGVPGARPSVRIYQPDPPPDAFTERLDAILAKIGETGRESLTDEEIRFLDEARTRLRRLRDQ